MRSGGIEVTEQSAIPVRPIFPFLLQLIALSFDMIGNDHLVGGLGTAVRIGRANWAVFWDGDHVRKTCCVAINGGGRREDDVGDVVLGHAAEQAYRTVDIGAVVFKRYLAGLADCLVGVSLILGIAYVKLKSG